MSVLGLRGQLMPESTWVPVAGRFQRYCLLVADLTDWALASAIQCNVGHWLHVSSIETPNVISVGGKSGFVLFDA